MRITTGGPASPSPPRRRRRHLAVHGDEVEGDEHEDGEPEYERGAGLPRRSELVRLLQGGRGETRVARLHQKADDRFQVPRLVREKLHDRLVSADGGERVQDPRDALHEHHVRGVARARLRAEYRRQGGYPPFQVRIQQLAELLVPLDHRGHAMVHRGLHRALELIDPSHQRVHLVLLHHEGHLVRVLLLGGRGGHGGRRDLGIWTAASTVG